MLAYDRLISTSATLEHTLIEPHDLQTYLFVVYALVHTEEVKTNDFHMGQSLLSQDEQVIYKTMPAGPKRSEFLLSRILLRHILADVLCQPAQTLLFRRTARGKLFLYPECGLFFNISHSANSILLGISRYADIGVDIEMIRSYQPRIARRFFSIEEYDYLEQLAPELQPSAFTQLWTVKEACAKAIGLGLPLLLQKIPLSVQTSSGCYQNTTWWMLPTVPQAKSAVALQHLPAKQMPERAKLIIHHYLV